MEFIKVGVGVYQNIPYLIDPVAWRIGSFSVGWYSIMYIVAFVAVFLLLRFRKREAVWKEIIQNFNSKLENEIILDFLIYSFIGLIIGARAGYVLFYNLPYYLANPSVIFSPLDEAGKFVGIYGMSYHGGLIGVLLATWYFTRKNKIHPPTKKPDKNSENNTLVAGLDESSFGEGVNFWKWADFVAPAVPAGFFFGRIGNFLNGELYGRVTARAWGMYFPAGGEILRHPSQLYEAFFEGLVLFMILWTLRNGIKYKSKMFHVPCFMLYVFLYGFFRFFLEFFREPDSQLGFVVKWTDNGLTLGQLLSLSMVLLAVALFLYQRSKKMYNETKVK